MWGGGWVVLFKNCILWQILNKTIKIHRQSFICLQAEMLSGSLEAKENEKISLRIYNSIVAAWANCTFTQVVTPFWINCPLKAQPNRRRRHSTPPWFFLPLRPSLSAFPHLSPSLVLHRGAFCIPLTTRSTSWMQIKDQIQSWDFLVCTFFACK